MSILNLNTLDKDKPEVIEDKPISEENKTETSTELPEVKQEPDEKTQVVVMDGPLGKIYTEALNLVFAKEAASASGQTDIKVVFDEDIEAENADLKKSLYVYCCDAGDTDTEDAIEGSDKLRVALDSGKYAGTYMIMESHDRVTRGAGLLEEYAVRNGVKVIFKRDIALEAISDAIKQ